MNSSRTYATTRSPFATNSDDSVHNQLRIIPELRFFIDDSLDYIDHIDELLKK